MKNMRVITGLLIVAILMQYLTVVSLADSPAAPQGFKAQINGSAVDISWTKVPSGVSYTLIEKSTGTGEFQVIASIHSGINSFKDNNVANGHIYRYRARNFNASGFSSYSGEVEIAFLYPVSLNTANYFSDQVNLVWTYPALAQHRTVNIKTLVERREDGKSNWETVYEAPYPETEFWDVGLKPNTLYHYRIRTQYSDGSYSQYIPYGTSVTARTSIPLTTSLWGYALSDSYIRLEWDASALNDHTLILQKQDPDGNFITIYTTRTDDHYIDYGLTAGKPYYYRMHLFSSNGMSSPFTETVEIKTESIPAPSNGAATSMAGGQITVTWNYPYEVESGFEVFRKEGSGPYERIAVVAKNSSAYQDHSAVYGASYTYKVRAFRGSNAYSAFTTSAEVINAQPNEPPQLIMAPMQGYLLVGCDSAPEGITYALEMRTGGINGKWTDLKSAQGTALIYYLFPNESMEMELRLRAENKGNIRYGQVYRFFGSVPEAPADLKVTGLGSNRVMLSWTDNTEKEEGYRIYRTVSGKRSLLAAISGDAEGYTDSQPIAGAPVKYEVVAYNIMGESKSASVQTTVPQKPSFRDTANLTWAASAIDALCGLGAFSQSSDRLFNPNRTITRAEFVTMMLKTYGIMPSGNYLFSLKDVSRDAWYYGYMMTAVKFGILIPDENGRAYPEAAMTREELAVTLTNLLACRGKPLNVYSQEVLTRYRDAYMIPDALKGVFASLGADSIFPPQGGQFLDYQAPVTRAEGAAVLYRFWRVYP